MNIGIEINDICPEHFANDVFTQSQLKVTRNGEDVSAVVTTNKLPSVKIHLAITAVILIALTVCREVSIGARNNGPAVTSNEFALQDGPVNTSDEGSYGGSKKSGKVEESTLRDGPVPRILGTSRKRSHGGSAEMPWGHPPAWGHWVYVPEPEPEPSGKSGKSKGSKGSSDEKEDVYRKWGHPGWPEPETSGKSGKSKGSKGSSDEVDVVCSEWRHYYHHRYEGLGWGHPGWPAPEPDPVGMFVVYEIEDGLGQSRRLKNQGDHSRHIKNIQLSDGTIYEVKNTQPGWADSLRSGKDSVHIPPDTVICSDGTIDMQGKEVVMVENHDSKRTLEEDRNLATLEFGREGPRTVLVVRVILLDGAYDHADQTGLSNDVFGNGVDTFNLKSGYAACSYNQLIFNKSPDRSMTNNPNDATTDISNGVVDIMVALPKSAGEMPIVDAVTVKINSVFRVTSPDQIADHVMYCLPSGIVTTAFALFGSWSSWYNNEWCNSPSGQMHEVRCSITTI